MPRPPKNSLPRFLAIQSGLSLSVSEVTTWLRSTSTGADAPLASIKRISCVAVEGFVVACTSGLVGESPSDPIPPFWNAA